MERQQVSSHSLDGFTLRRQVSMPWRYDDPQQTPQSPIDIDSHQPRNELLHGDEGRSLKRLPSHSYDDKGTNYGVDGGDTVPDDEKSAVHRVFSLLHTISHVQQFLTEHDQQPHGARNQRDPQEQRQFGGYSLISFLFPQDDGEQEVVAESECGVHTSWTQEVHLVSTLHKLLPEINRYFLFQLEKTFSQYQQELISFSVSISTTPSSPHKYQRNQSHARHRLVYHLNNTLSSLFQLMKLVLERNYAHTYDDDGFGGSFFSDDGNHTLGTVHHVIRAEYRNLLIFIELLFQALHDLENTFRVSPYPALHRCFSNHQHHQEQQHIEKTRKLQPDTRHVASSATSKESERVECEQDGEHSPENYHHYRLFIQDLMSSTSSSGGGSSSGSSTYLLSTFITWEGKGQCITLLFWLKYFHPETFETSWSKFANVFQQEYGSQVSECMDLFCTSICSTLETVSLRKLLIFASSYDSLYAGFREKCPPPTMMILCGSLDVNFLDYPPSIMRSLYKESIKELSCGDNHLAVVTTPGKVYTWGRGTFGRLGHGNNNDILQPLLVSALQHMKIEHASCGFAYSFFINDQGQVFACGTGENGRMGTGDTIDRSIPIRLHHLEDHFIVGKSFFPFPFFCGLIDILSFFLSFFFFAAARGASVHSCFLTKTGRVFTCGSYQYAGFGTHQDVLIPRELNLNGEKIQQISVSRGGFHTLALSEHGTLYSWGHNRVGQLGFPPDPETCHRADDGGLYFPIPQRVPNIPTNIHMVSLLMSHKNRLISCLCAKLCLVSYHRFQLVGDILHLQLPMAKSIFVVEMQKINLV
jgi:hypothetical protein